MGYGRIGLGSLIAAACMATASGAPATEDAKTETVWTVQLKGISG